MEDRIGKLNDGGYNNLLLVVVFAVVVYLFVNGFTKSKQQAYLNNAGTDKTTQLAQALRDAMNRSGIKIMMPVDGTDVDLVMSTATEITDYKAVSDAYRVLYSSELTTDLQEELSRTDLQRFYDIVYKRQTGPTTSTTTGGVTTTAGKNAKANQTVNVRNYDTPSKVEKQVTTGTYLGRFAGEKTLTVTGPSLRYYILENYQYSVFGVGFFTVQTYVLKSAVTLY